MSNKHFTTNHARAESIARERAVRAERQRIAAERRALKQLQRKFAMRGGRVVA